MKVFSHRGYHFGADVHENTCAAFERAIEFGVDGIETDIRLSADQQPILYHDRLAPDGQAVEDLTRTELEEIVGFEVPGLAEVLARWPDVFWNLEIKSGAALDPAISLLKRHSHLERILVSSFRHDLVLHCAKRLDVACGLIMAHAPVDLPGLLAPFEPHPRIRTIVWDFNVLEVDLVAQAHRGGLQVFAYGAASRTEHELARAWRIDGLITDYPDRVNTA